jgi:hypothetical protein
MTIITVGKSSREVGNLAKVLFATEFTKGEMLAYYQAPSQNP